MVNQEETETQQAQNTPLDPTDALKSLTQAQIKALISRKAFVSALDSGKIQVNKIKRILDYETQLKDLQIELVKLQRWVQQNDMRVAVLFEGRDAAGKGGAIRRFIEHLNPRAMRVVALPKPSELEQGQWYFQRYAAQLPNAGEIVFFDRSWYNRAVVEPVNGFCTESQYERFLQQLPEFELMLHNDGIHLVKFWFSISKDEQLERFEARKTNPLKQWKLSPIDARAQELWDQYTHYKRAMFRYTHTPHCPWIIVKANSKKLARLESIRYVLSSLDYDDKNTDVRIEPKPEIIFPFDDQAEAID